MLFLSAFYLQDSNRGGQSVRRRAGRRHLERHDSGRFGIEFKRIFFKYHDFAKKHFLNVFIVLRPFIFFHALKILHFGTFVAGELISNRADIAVAPLTITNSFKRLRVR